MKKSETTFVAGRPPKLGEAIERRIHLVRAQKVMFDQDLAGLSGVTTKAFNQAVKRNLSRFPEDFMFRLTQDEDVAMWSQFVTASRRNVRYLPYVFTEQGVAMLSSVLRSHRAIQVNISIMRAFVNVRELAATHKDLAQKLDALEKKYQHHDIEIKAIFDAIRKLIEGPAPRPARRIGFLAEARLRS